MGREVSLSPVETARAFEAPLLGDVGSNAGPEEMAKIASERLRYGVLSSKSGDQLSFGYYGEVSKPRDGQALV